LQEFTRVTTSPYSPELNPIEQFWSIVKNKVKNNSFEATEDLATRATEVYNKKRIAYHKKKVITFTTNYLPFLASTLNYWVKNILNRFGLDSSFGSVKL
jgi:hypothetical protein